MQADIRRSRLKDGTAAILFGDAARPEVAEPLYEKFVELVKSYGVNVATGKFGGDMKVEIHNDGPVTLMIESK